MNDTAPTLALLALDSLDLLEPSENALRASRIIGFDKRNVQSRPFELLRTSFAKKIKESGARMVGITSATPAAGKSFLSLNLAASLARVSDVPVYLVDLDLRRASVAEDLGMTTEHGVEAYLSGATDDLRSLGAHISGTQLAVFPAIRGKKNTAELLAGSRYQDLQRKLRDETGGAIVIFDMPPAFAGDDTMISMDALDGYLMVIDSGRTTKKQMREMQMMLDPTPCLGAILNRYRGGFGDPYGYGSDKYSRYYD